jgi:hypothetical protein
MIFNDFTRGEHSIILLFGFIFGMLFSITSPLDSSLRFLFGISLGILSIYAVVFTLYITEEYLKSTSKEID